MSDKKHPFSGFGKLHDRGARLTELLIMGAITPAHAEMLRQEGISKEWGEQAVGNFLGYYAMPLSITCLPINNNDIYIPYANEESSVMEAASNAGSIFRRHGATIQTESVGEHLSVGQIFVVVDSTNSEIFTENFNEIAVGLVDAANKNAGKDMVNRGGGVKRIWIDQVIPGIEKSKDGFIIHASVDTVDAMGANVVTKICENIGKQLSESTGCEWVMRILTNYVDKTVKAKVVLPNFDAEAGRRLQLASNFAKKNLYRAVTHNKGMLNALMAIAIATGNDSRAMAILFSSYAINSGNMSLSTWEMVDEHLVGLFEAPIDIGVAGGAMMHPTATICMEIMKVKTAKELREVMGAAALAQNFAALLALTNPKVSFSEKHLGCHAPSYARMAGASGKEIKQVAALIRVRNALSSDGARKALAEIRGIDPGNEEDTPS